MRKVNYFYNNQIILLRVYRTIAPPVCYVSFRKLAPCITDPIFFYPTFKDRQVYRNEKE